MYKQLSVLLIGCLFVFSSCNYIQNVRLLTGGKMHQEVSIETISFEYPKKIIVISGEIPSAGGKRKFIFDTGAFNSKIGKTFADSLGYPNKATKDNSTAQGVTQKIEVTRMDSIYFGETLFTNIGAGKLSYSSQSASKCLAPTGIVGANLIKLAHWKIDYQKQEISFSDEAFNLEDKEDLSVLPFKRPVFSGTPKISIQVADRSVEGVLFDVGYNGGLILPAQFADSFQSDSTTKVIDRSTTGIYGSNTDTLITKELHVSLGNGSFTIPVEFSSIGKALIGNEILEHFEVYINYSDKTISLEQISKVEVPKGLTFIPGMLNDSLWVVNRTYPNLDLVLGDTLNTINGLMPGEVFSSFCDYIMNVQEFLNQKLEIVTSREDILMIMLD